MIKASQGKFPLFLWLLSVYLLETMALISADDEETKMCLSCWTGLLKLSCSAIPLALVVGMIRIGIILNYHPSHAVISHRPAKRWTERMNGWVTDWMSADSRFQEERWIYSWELQRCPTIRQTVPLTWQYFSLKNIINSNFTRTKGHFGH